MPGNKLPPDDEYEEFDESEVGRPPQTFAEQFWENLGTHGKPVPVEIIKKLAMERPVTHGDVQYLMSRFMYLDLCNGDIAEPPSDEAPAIIIKAQSDWLIYDRRDRLTAGPGRLVFGAYRLEEDDDKGGEGGGAGGNLIGAGNGTLAKQLFDTALELIALAAGRWPMAVILGGYGPMQRAAWMAAQETGFSINYTPNAEDEKMYQTIKQQTGAFRLPGRTPKPRAG